MTVWVSAGQSCDRLAVSVVPLAFGLAVPAGGGGGSSSGLLALTAADTASNALKDGATINAAGGTTAGGAASDVPPCLCDGSFLSGSHPMLHLGEGLFIFTPI